ncbi:MFS transporter [Niabella ginsengisoli]|uniref:MFS transporter n=1 Tax=Niabella ginsengisoli TaxID=522298 RepID=A0ABS9SL44_9BACT|nr:MFS transporter [Niabella ginsengisoli]MCH5599107.1 MFS transporter [Niabella ginsengisoli]
MLRSFVGPCFSAMIATIVPKNLLQNATTWNQGTWLSASVTGHAVGGFLIAFIGISSTILVISSLILLSIIFLFQLKPKPPIQIPVEGSDVAFTKQPEKKTWESIKEGLAFVFQTKALLAAMALDMFAVLFGGAVAMIPVFASDILKIGPKGFGWLNAATDIGAIFIVVILTLWPIKKHKVEKCL